MAEPTTSPIDLIWLLLVPLGVLLFLALRRPKRRSRLIATLSIISIASGWAIAYAWMYLKFDRPNELTAFNSVDYLMRELPNAWLWRYLATFHGWIPGVLLFALAGVAARLWPHREPL